MEREVRRLAEVGDRAGAATRAIEGYGPEVLGYLCATLGDRALADDAFADVAEALWRALPGFAWRSSVRTLVYALARNVRVDLVRRERVRRRRAAPLSEAAEVAERVRTRTATMARTEAREGVARLREELAPDDRELLVLRVDRAMAWAEIAAILAPDDDPARAAARLRKRFQLVKDEIRARARALGIGGGEA